MIKKLLLILLCLPMIGFGQSKKKQILSLEKKIEILYKDVLNESLINDSLRNTIDSLESEIDEYLAPSHGDICYCEGDEYENIIGYWNNGKIKYFGWKDEYGNEYLIREWYKNGELKTIYVWGGCEYNHELVETIEFNENGRYIETNGNIKEMIE